MDPSGILFLRLINRKKNRKVIVKYRRLDFVDDEVFLGGETGVVHDIIQAIGLRWPCCLTDRELLFIFEEEIRIPSKKASKIRLLRFKITRTLDR